MSIWDKQANLQGLYQSNNGRQVAAPLYDSNGYVNYGVAHDIAENLNNNVYSFSRAVEDGKNIINDPNQSPLFNDKVEKARQSAISALGAASQSPAAAIALGATLGKVTGPLGYVGGAAAGLSLYGMGELDQATGGRLGNALMSGTKGVRSNYAFVREATNTNTSYGLLAGLGQVAGALLAAGGTIAAATAAGSVVPGIGNIVGFLGSTAAVLGFYGAGKAERALAESGKFGSELQQAAKFAQSAQGQEKYNIGRDVTKAAGHIAGFKTLQNTDTGIGAVTSGVINFFTEVSLTPDIKGVQLTGGVARAATVGGITKAKQGLVAGRIQKQFDTPEKVQARINADVDLIKKTAAGEKTSYTPMFEFINKNDAATVKQRTEFALGDEISHVAAQLMAGKSYDEIGLILRIGRGDATALKELQQNHASTFAQLIRSESKLNRWEANNLPSTSSNKYISKALKDKKKILDDELADMVNKNAELSKVLKLDSALQERTVSVIPAIERWRNDVAKQRIANKLGINKEDLTSRETKLGQIVQKVYQSNAFGAPIRAIERWTDDAPHMTVNFNDVLQSTGRVRASIRTGVEKGIFAKDEVVKLYNDFLNAKFEAGKLKFIDDYTKNVVTRIGKKYSLPESSIDLILQTYLKRMKMHRQEAVDAASKNRAYMKDPVTGEVVSDPVLVSQLANGSYLPDIELLDNAFKQFRNMSNKEFGGIVNLGLTGKWLLDEYNSLWRNFTLMRVGYPINILRDNTLRIAADGQWFNTVKYWGKETLEDFTNSNNSVGRITRWAKGLSDKKYSLKTVKEELNSRVKVLADAEANLKKANYNFNKPPKNIKPEVQRTLDNYNNVKASVDALQKQEQFLLGKIPANVVGRNSIPISDYSFDSYRGGRFGKLTLSKIMGKDDIRGLIESNRELQLAELRRGRTGGKWIEPTLQNEDLHLRSWENILVNVLPSDPIAMKIMQGVPKKDVISFIKSKEFRAEGIDRFGYTPDLKRNLRSKDAQYIYKRVEDTVNQFAPDAKLQKLIVDNKVDILALKKMYPDVKSRPGVNTDMALDLLGQSGALKTFNKFTRDVVTWAATVPTSKLSYNPYFRANYEQKLQSMVAVANAQGRKLSKMDQATFESNARAYALKELRTKLNAFSRDMNYPGLLDYTIAFFPAIAEQYRVYGRLMAENPEFLLKTMQMRMIPNRLGDVQVDANGDEYVEVSLPLIGPNVKARLSTSWFNPFNPTGGNIISTSPWVASLTNEILKNYDVELPKQLEQYILPFGVQQNSLTPLTPTTIRRASQAFSAWKNDNNSTLQKDIAMIAENKLFEFQQNNHRQPNVNELKEIQDNTTREAKGLALIRFAGSLLLPQQPRYVSPLQVYSDKLRKYQEQYGGSDGTQKFLEDYSDYWIVVDKLTDPTSGLYPDRTAVNLIKKNKNVVQKMIITMGTDVDLRTLGAVFNDENYAFSSSAQAWLQTNKIPYTDKLFTSSQTALENSRSAIVNKGWKEWNKMIEIVQTSLLNNNPPYSPASGYGKAILDTYKQNFMEKMKTDNKIWYEEKLDRDSSAGLKNVVDNLTIAANTPELWKDLSKQARWHSITEYLNFRYYIYDKLKERRVPITSDKAYDIRQEVDDFVVNLRQNDINFGKFYDRYFDGDDFTHVYEE